MPGRFKMQGMAELVDFMYRVNRRKSYEFRLVGSFCRSYLKTPVGQGVFLSGIVLGIITKYQVSKGESIDSAPMFKQLMFGKMQRRDLLRHLSRVPELIGLTIFL